MADVLVVDHESRTAKTRRCFGVLIFCSCGAVVIAVASQREGSRFDLAFLFCAWEGFPWVVWFPPTDQNMYIRLIGGSILPLGMSV